MEVKLFEGEGDAIEVNAASCLVIHLNCVAVVQDFGPARLIVNRDRRQISLDESRQIYR